ncbi:MAG TPA: 2'-5' RNA ligase family protein [Flavitalea sp.]|nr:2'-5' RNA ligase family protein [Flavitalea sp.]
MEQLIQLMPGYRLHEYQLAIIPHEDLRRRIQDARNDFAERFQLARPWQGPVHLMLVRFRQVEMLEDKLQQALKAIIMGIRPFKIGIDGYRSSPSHSIHLNVITGSVVMDLVKQLKQAGRIMRSAENEPHWIQEPTISIANKLLPWQYEQGWANYRQRSFTAAFMADELVLLKKTGSANRLQVVSRFECLDMPVLTKQGELF